MLSCHKHRRAWLEPQDNVGRLRELAREMLAQRKLILASNRGPVEYAVSDDGTAQPRRGSGGVVTALSAVSQYAELTWVACAMGEGDRRVAATAAGRAIKSPLAGQKLNIRFITPPRNVYHKYYNEFCNPLLWFLQHNMWNSPRTPNIDARVHDAWHDGYVRVNKAFAETVAEEARDSDPPPFVMLHDYHLYLAAGYIRSLVPGVILQHFTHIPWPAPRYWQLLPAAMRQAICENICANDIVGMQTLWDVRNFLHTCEAFLAGAEVDYRSRTVWHKGHLSTVNAYPISIDVAGLQRLARSNKVREYEAKLTPLRGEHTIVRVDRLEPSKNILRGFRAFDVLLQRHPQLVGKVKYWAFLVPSRTDIRQYQRYAEDVMSLIDDINRRYGSGDWRPIEVFYENNYPQAIAAMRLYDVLVVNAVVDGMNLVAKEGAVVNTRSGVLILSETVGAHEQLGEHALSVAPADIEGTMQAMYQALTMPPEERKRRAEALRLKVQTEDITLWLCRQFEDLLALA